MSVNPPDNDQQEEVFENEYVKYWFEDGFLLGRFKCEKLDIEAGKKILELRLQITDAKSFSTCVDSTKVKAFPKEARDYLSKGRAYDNITFSGIIVNNPVGRMLGNFYLSLKPPPIPTRLFKNFGDAKKWFATQERKLKK